MTFASVVANPQPTQATPLVPNTSTPSSGGSAFQTLLDTINPLQHIPIVSSMYRAATGSSISTGAQVAGDSAYGMLLGGGAIFAIASSIGSAAADAVSTSATGTTVGGNIVGAVSSTNATPLVPDSGEAALRNAIAAAHPAATFMPLDPKHQAQTEAQFSSASIQGEMQKKLVNMGS